MSKSILFVDDEKAILKSIKREFIDTNFKIYLAENGKEALKILYESSEIDMIISDLMMPDMNGYELLKKVRYLYPDIIRIVLSGHADKYLMFKCVNENIAKAYLYKPWENEELINTVSEVFENYDKLNRKNLKEIISYENKLPTIPELFLQINKLIQDDNSSIDEIVKLINKDQTMAYEVLKTINSSFYGIKTGSIKTAILNLGLENLKAIIATVTLFDLGSASSYYKKLLWEHSNLTNVITVELYEKINNKKIPEQYSTAGLLHDIGKVIFLKLFDNKYEKLLQMREEDSSVEISVYEKKVFDFTHEELGSLLLSWWQLPTAIVETALKHSDPLEANKIYKNIACIVNVADHYSWKIINPKFMREVNEEVYKYLNITKEECEIIISHYNKGDYGIWE